MVRKKSRYYAMLFASAGLALALPGCANMPNMPGLSGISGGSASSASDSTCSVNGTALGALLGAAGGGGIGYAIGHDATATILGTLAGAALGGYLGDQEDQRCQAAAQAQALAQADAYAQAHPAQLPVETVQESEAPDPVVYVHHHRHYVRPPLENLPAQSYSNSQSGTNGSEVALTPYIDKDSGNECTNITEIASKSDGTTKTATITKCRTPPDGPWQTVASAA